MTVLSVSAVQAIMVDSLYKDEEMPDPGKAPEGAILVEGVLHNYGFHPERLRSHKEEIVALLNELDPVFHASGGGGMSFLNACVDKNGHQWGEHIHIEQLYALGAAVGAASFPLPKALWGALPGGMPYISIDTSKVH